MTNIGRSTTCFNSPPIHNIYPKMGTKLWITMCLLLISVLSCTDPHCTTCPKNPDTCTACKPGYRPVMGRCDPCDAPHCLTCKESQNYCTTCEEGYKQQEGRCSACRVEHCSRCPLSVSACLQCEKGYHLVSNRCQTKTSLLQE